MEGKKDVRATTEGASVAVPSTKATEQSGQLHGQDLERGNALRRIKTKFGDRPECFKTTFHEVSFVFQAIVAMATTSFLTGVGIIITSRIGQDLNMTQGEIAWITASTSLVAGAFQLALGQLADLIGRRMMFLAGMGSFSAFVLLAAFAQNPFWMVIVCGILGIPSAMAIPPAIGILGAAYKTPSPRKNLVFSAFSAGNPLGFVMGLIVSGICASVSTWRSAYIVLAIFWAVFTVHAYFVVPDVENFDRGSFRDRLGLLKQFDYVGTILTIFGTGMFTAALTLGPEDGWQKPHVIAMLIVGVALLVVFVFWERIWPHPLMPPHVWKNRNFSLVMIIVNLGMMAFTGTTFWVSFFMQELQRLSTITVAVHLLPMAVGGLLINVVAAKILHKVNNTLLMGIGSVAYLGAALLFSFMKADSIFWAFIFPALILNVAGADLQFCAGNMFIMTSLPSEKQATAGAIFNTFTRLSQTAVMGITTAVFGSIESTPEGLADPMLKYARVFQTCIAFAAAGIVFVPFLRIGTQGNALEHEEELQLAVMPEPQPESGFSKAGREDVECEQPAIKAADGLHGAKSP